ncbi:Tetratricopeptide repeat-containing protein [Alteribacillus persepolensis]|uniref:Tetratricopeptide repeat-containing protein n=1 Tax=Alteribacillus persepolensis TaxID=568899 RepID=A0A1G8AJE3_9BACI|nr:tetratricopeptide repeat protein [Alteribacillus persepolensis]SDH21019.1 Tetratricopeptide repeat-containing protein [Alteribacillus persepolensis]
MNRQNNYRKGQIIPFIQNGEYFFKRGVTAYQNNQLQRAVKYLRRAVELNPEQGVFYCQLAAVYADLADYEKSNALLLYVLDELDETMYECYFFLANNYAYQGLFDRAREMANLYLSCAPEGDFTADAEDLLQLLKLEGVEDDEAEEEWLRTGDELIITYEKALRMIEENKLLEAENLLENIITDYPSYWPAHSQLAQVLHLKGQTEEALAYIKDILQENHYVPAMCQLALFYKELGRETEAQDTTLVLKKMVPMDKDHLQRVAITLCCLREYEGAYHLFRTLFQRFYPEDKTIFFQYGVASYQTGRYQQAKKWWRQAEVRNHNGASQLLAKMQDGLLTASDVMHVTHEQYRY